MSRHHAQVVHDGSSWRIHDLGSKYGLRINGVRDTEGVLLPGVEIGIGGNLNQATARLGMAACHSRSGKWIGRRRLPMPVDHGRG